MQRYALALEQLRDQHLIRTPVTVTAVRGAFLRVGERDLLGFCNNDYLGLAQHPEIVAAARRALDRYGVGAGASAAISGRSEAQDALEETLAEWLGVDRVMTFSSGYACHLGVIPTLVGGDTAVFSDALNHASLIDGIRLARPGQLTVYPHADLEALESALVHCPFRERWIISDGVFSMDGDVAPLAGILELAERHDAGVLVDDAHGFGVLGNEGRGSLAACGIESDRVLQMATLGKAAGVSGAFLGGARILMDWIAQRARTHLFSTAAPPILAAATLAALDRLRTDDWRRERLWTLNRRIRTRIGHRLPSGDGLSPAILPLLIGANRQALDWAAELDRRGLWVPAIRPPTVLPGTARLRISLNAHHQPEDVDRLLDAVTDLLNRMPLP